MSALQAARRRLFGTWYDALITLACLYLVVAISVPLLRWALVDATWTGLTRDDCRPGGACWVFIRVRFAQFMYGFYPAAERWRVDLAGLLLVGGCAAIALALRHRRLLPAALVAVALPVAGVVLLAGGFGLRPVETRDWGGLMLTVFIAFYAAIIAVPLGVVLALGRASRLPVIRLLCVVFIEFWRAVPIIAVIFLASLLLPLILPGGFDIDRLARAVVGLGLVIAAYMAEAVRGGLQALPDGQREAATALGLRYWTATGLIVLPQVCASPCPR